MHSQLKSIRPNQNFSYCSSHICSVSKYVVGSLSNLSQFSIFYCTNLDSSSYIKNLHLDFSALFLRLQFCLCRYLFFIVFSMFFVVSLLRMDVTCIFVLKEIKSKGNIQKYFPLISGNTFLFFCPCMPLLFCPSYLSFLILFDSSKLMRYQNKSVLCTSSVSFDINMPDWVHVEGSLLYLFHFSLDLPRINGLCVSQHEPD